MKDQLAAVRKGADRGAVYVLEDTIERLQVGCVWLETVELPGAIGVQSDHDDTAIRQRDRAAGILENQTWFASKRGDTEDTAGTAFHAIEVDPGSVRGPVQTLGAGLFLSVSQNRPVTR